MTIDKRFGTITYYRPGTDADLIYTWDRTYLKDDKVLMCFYPNREHIGAGFCFYALEWVTAASDPVWDDPETTASCICRGVALFDGIRHLNWGDPETGNEGYLYYPDMDILNCILLCLRNLELEHCDGVRRKNGQT